MTEERSIALRHELHKLAESSGSEIRTSRLLIETLEQMKPDSLITGLGGKGIAAVFDSGKPGFSLLLRCDMDAVPVDEKNNFPYQSENPGVSHKCGHDGHMAVMAAVAARLSMQRPASGRVILLYQPSEEDGRGAAAVLEDPRFEGIRPDFAFAMHNLPGYPLGLPVLRRGSFSCASRGMSVRFTGSPTHAAHPEKGKSPALAMCRFIEGMSFATVVGAKLGERAFGTAPGDCSIWATLRSEGDEGMDEMVFRAETLARQLAGEESLSLEVGYDDVFMAVENSDAAMDLLVKAAGDRETLWLHEPFRWSEDFGRFSGICEAALFGMGAGTDLPPLHDENYDFPDDLISPAAELFLDLIDICLGLSGHTPQLSRKR